MSRSRVVVILSLATLLLSTAACDSSNSGGNTDTTPPAAPSSLTGTSGDGVITLEWNAPSDNDLDGYLVYRSGSAFSDASGAQRVSGDAPIEQPVYDDTEVENGTTYYYRVAAVDEAGNESDLSSSVDKPPFPDPPDEP